MPVLRGCRATWISPRPPIVSGFVHPALALESVHVVTRSFCSVECANEEFIENSAVFGQFPQ